MGNWSTEVLSGMCRDGVSGGLTLTDQAATSCWRWPSRPISAYQRAPAVVGDLREDGCHADVQIAIGPTRLVARITRHSAARVALAPNKPVFAVIKSVAIDGGGLALLSPD
jgi:molybdopterin-binding protein